LTEHAENKHKATVDKCFDRLPEETAKEKSKRLAKEAEEAEKAEKAEKAEAKRLAKEREVAERRKKEAEM